MMEAKWLWLSTVLLLLLEGCERCKTNACWEDERIALLQLKPFFNFYNDLKSWVDIEVEGSDCCQWERVECNHTTMRVIALSLNDTRYWSNDYNWYLNTSLFLPLKQLKRLYLPENAIAGFVENEGFENLSVALGNLEVLDLSGNQLNDTILLSLSLFTSLKHLYLGRNNFAGSNRGFQWLSRLTNLEILDLSYNELNYTILSSLSQLSISLKHLYLRGNHFTGSSHGFQWLSRLTNLEILDFTSNNLNDTILSSLSQLSISLKHLYLENNHFTGSSHGFERLSRLTNLETLDLSWNPLKNSVLFHMGGLSSLKTLNLASTNLKGRVYIHELNNLTKLKTLDLSFNRIESLGPSKQGKQTQLRLTNLEVLYLRNNSLRNDTFSYLAGLSSLKSLFMARNRLQGTINKGPELKLTDLQDLELSDNLIDDSIFASLRAFRNLKTLFISSNSLNGSRDMKELGALTNLEELDLSNNVLDEFVAHKEFKNLRKLKVLDLNGVFTNGSIPLLVKLVEAFPSVKTFSLQQNYLNTTVATHQELNVPSSVEEINLDSSYLNNNIFQSIGAFTSLKILSLSNCGLIGSLPNQGWCDLRNLEVLDISSNALEGTLPYCFGNLTSLRELDVSDNQFTGNLTPLRNLTSVILMYLSRNRFQISMPFTSLENLSNLKILLGDENKLLMEPNSFNISVPKFQLKIIRLSRCTTNHGLSLEPPNFLYYQYELSYVDLSYNNFIGRAPMWLLKNNPKLEVLLLMGNSLTGPLSLPSVFNLNISSIDISNNKLYGQIPMNICSTFPNLERLFLSKNAFEGNIPHCLSSMGALLFLDLSNNHLSGRVPDEMIMKSSFVILKLSNNNLCGKIVPAIFNSSSLSCLYLDGNRFAGEIPDIDISIADFSYSSLLDIDISNNTLSGKLPKWIGNISSLVRLAFSNNHFEGSIPVEWCNLSRLEFLDLSENNLYGYIPSCLNPPHIRHVHLNANKLSGPLTFSFYNSSSLVTLDLRGNSLMGNIPKWIGTFPALSVLLLQANHLDGTIPVQLCKLYSLSIIDLSKNMFSGPIPYCLGNLTMAMNLDKSLMDGGFYEATLTKSTYIGNMALEPYTSYSYPDSYIEEWIEFTTKSGSRLFGGNILPYMSGIDLSCNKLTGQIPEELGNLSEIHSLNLSHNNLIGAIPSSFSNLKQIESLDLSHNNLNGRIPAQLVELTSLEVFNVAHNNLSGTTPERKAQFGTFDESSYEGNPLLCGPPLPNSCSGIESPSTVPTKTDDEGEGSFMDTYVFCVSFLVSYIIVVLGIVVVLYINPYWRQAWFSFIERCITTCRYSIVGDFLELYIIKTCA